MKAMQARYRTVFVTGVGDQQACNHLTQPIKQHIDTGIDPQASSSANQELGFPASLASKIPMVVVGASDVNGRRAPFSLMSPLITVYAPGVDIICASPEGGAQFRSGTSFAAGMVSGLAAYYLSVRRFYEPLNRYGGDERTNNMIRLIKQLAWVRSSSGGDVPVIYNGYTPPVTPPSCSVAVSIKKREACSEFSSLPCFFSNQDLS